MSQHRHHHRTARPLAASGRPQPPAPTVRLIADGHGDGMSPVPPTRR